jgi:hypothetical protein
VGAKNAKKQPFFGILVCKKFVYYCPALPLAAFQQFK